MLLQLALGPRPACALRAAALVTLLGPLGALGALASGCRSDIPRPVDVETTDGGRDAGRDGLDSRPADAIAADAVAKDGPDALATMDASDGQPADVTLTVDMPLPVDTPPLPPDMAVPAVDMPPARPGCGSDRPDITGIQNANGLAIGMDGTIYFTQSAAPVGWVGRLRPGMPVESRWVSVPDGAQLWGLAVDSMRQRLYVASASGHIIHQIALGGATPTLAPFTRDVDLPNKLVVGAGGVVYFADSDTKIYRVQPTGDLYESSARGYGNNASAGLAFTKTGDMLVGTLSNGQLFKVTLDGGIERTRNPLGSFRGWIEAIALDETGRIYVSNHGATGAESQVIRLNADGAAPMPLLDGPAFRGLAFGRGALDCRDLYVASQSGPLRRITTDSYGLPVP
jgi:sugar lactone lactonase YvrE